jgi:hypothetical protein
MHQTIAGCSWAVRIAAGLPNLLWWETYRPVAQLVNFPLTAALPNGKTPHKAFKLMKPDVSFLHKVGCKVFVLKQNVHNPKLYSRLYKGSLLGTTPSCKHTASGAHLSAVLLCLRTCTLLSCTSLPHACGSPVRLVQPWTPTLHPSGPPLSRQRRLPPCLQAMHPRCPLQLQPRLHQPLLLRLPRLATLPA